MGPLSADPALHCHTKLEAKQFNSLPAAMAGIAQSCSLPEVRGIAQDLLTMIYTAATSRANLARACTFGLVQVLNHIISRRTIVCFSAFTSYRREVCDQWVDTEQRAKTVSTVLRTVYMAAASQAQLQQVSVITVDQGVQAGNIVCLATNHQSSLPLHKVMLWEELELGELNAASDSILVRCVNDQQEVYLKRADICSLALPFPEERAEAATIQVAQVSEGQSTNVDTSCILKMLSWNIDGAARPEDQLGILEHFLQVGDHEIFALQGVCTATAQAIQKRAEAKGFDYFGTEMAELTAPGKLMRNLVLARRGVMTSLDHRVLPSQLPWTGHSQFAYPPVTVAGTYTRAGRIQIGITSMHTQDVGAYQGSAENELARTLGVAAQMAEENDLDIMVVIGNANLQHIEKLNSASEVSACLAGGVTVRTPESYEQYLGKRGLKPAGAIPKVHWWLGANHRGPWVLVRPKSMLPLSSTQVNDCAFVLRRRPVPAAGLEASTLTSGTSSQQPRRDCQRAVKRNSPAHESFNSHTSLSDHRPIEVTWRF